MAWIFLDAHSGMGEASVVEIQHSSAMRSGWSETVNGLSGQLYVALDELHPGLRYAVYLELWNQSPTAIAVIDQPQIQAELLDKAGKVLPAAGMNMSGPISAPQWGVIPGDAYLGFRIDMRTVGMPTREQGRVLLALGGRAWELSPGNYDLKLNLTFNKDQNGPRHQWTGRLKMPSLVVVVAF